MMGKMYINFTIKQSIITARLHEDVLNVRGGQHNGILRMR